MASHHDIPECEIVFESEGDRSSTQDVLRKLDNDCEKNPGHPTFIRVNEFGREHLPLELRTEDFMRSLKKRCELTVKIEVRYTSKSRPDTFHDNSPFPWAEYRGSKRHVRFGTGIVVPLSNGISYKQCPCPLCKNSKFPKMLFWLFTVKTATHVIFDTAEAEYSEFECFFDTDDRAGVKILYGCRVDDMLFTPESKGNTDACYCICVTHDEDTATRLMSSLTFTIGDVFKFPYDYCPLKDVMVSHPHGASKRMTVGNILYWTVPVEPKYKTSTPTPFWDDTICRLPMEPWAPDGNPTPSLKDFEFYDFITFSDNMKEFIKIQSFMPTRFEEKIYFVFRTSVKRVHNFVLENDSLTSTLHRVQQLHEVVIFILHRRTYNIKKSQTKTVKLLDITWLLLRCFLLLLIDDMGKYSYTTTKLSGTDDLILETFQWDMLRCFPEYLKHSNLQRYVAKQSQEHKIQDREYSSHEKAMSMMTRIVVADDVDGEGEPIPIWIQKEIGFLLIFFELQYFRRFHQLVFIIEKSKIPVDKFMQPGTEFKLPCNYFFTLPPEAKYAFRCYQGKPAYFMFPPGTKFHLKIPHKNMCVDVPLPSEAEFMSQDMTSGMFFSVNYDIDTCKGSSGASFGSLHNIVYQHRGSSDDNTNRSAPINRHGYIPGLEELYDSIR